MKTWDGWMSTPVPEHIEGMPFGSEVLAGLRAIGGTATVGELRAHLSRSEQVVRQALSRLAARGYVELLPNRTPQTWRAR